MTYKPAPAIEALEGRQFFASTAVHSITSLPGDLISLATRATPSTGLTAAGLLTRLEKAVRGVAAFQNSSGAIVDPAEKREIQYSTPYFAYAASVLLANGRATDLLTAATKAMDWASSKYGQGIVAIPDRHGEFYLYPLAKAYTNLKPRVTAAVASTWLTRLKTPISNVLEGHDWNWRTYAMKGAWALYEVGAQSRADVVNFIESSWTAKQKGRLVGNTLGQYEDTTSDPDTFAYDYAARANLTYLSTSGYDGPSAAAITTAVTKGNTAGLYLIDPTGQVSNTGRSGNHVWNDLVAAVSFERQAKLTAANGFPDTAAAFHHAAAVSVLSTDRWQRADGLYSVTKNRIDSAQKRGYAIYSGLTNYNGYMILHLGELIDAWQPGLAEKVMPAETGGYALKTAYDFSTAVADAGGVHVNAALRGDTAINNGQYWTQLGVTRVSETKWDSRLGNLSGENPNTKAAFSLAPAYQSGGTWKRMAESASTYTATFSADLTTPQLTRVTVKYAPRSGTSPTLTQTMTVTPDGVLMTLSTTGPQIAVTLPLLVSDGNATKTAISSKLATTSFTADSDSLGYLLLDSGATITDTGTVIQGATGDYKPLLATRAGQKSMSVFIYTRRAGEIGSSVLQQSMTYSGTNYSSALGRVSGTAYVGAKTAGGFGSSVDLNRDGEADATFSRPVQWVMLLSGGKVTDVEIDDVATLTYAGKSYSLSADTACKLS